MALKKLREHFQDTNINAFHKLLGNRVMVVEKISAPSFYVRRTEGKFEFYKSSNSEPLTRVDRTMMSLYEVAIKHIQSLSPASKDQLPNDFKFGFDYLPDVSVSEYAYEEVPHNNLILTRIQQLTESGKVKKTIIDPAIINKWAQVLDVQAQKPIFDGMLTQNQKNSLIKLLEMNDREFEKSFDYLVETDNETSFTKEIYRIFDMNSTKTVLQKDLESEIDGLVLNFVEGKKIQSYKLEDFVRKPINEGRESSHIYQITIADILEFVNMFDFNEIQLTEERADERYIELMSVVFNEYVSKNASKFIGVNFESAEFSTSDYFKLNTNFIKNEKTVRHVSNDILAELFKITLGSFRKPRTKSSDILNDDMIKRLNEMVEKINKIVLAQDTNENSIQDFRNFMLHNRIVSNTNLSEGLTVKYGEQGKEPVNIFVGRFQPFTLGHAKVLETIHKENGYPVIVFLIKAKSKKKGDEFRKPYSEDLQIKMFKQVQKQYKFLKDIIVLDRAAIDYMFNALRPKYEPVLWGTGSDRMKSYGYQVNKDTYRDELNVRADFGLYEIPRTDDNISATKVRNALLDGNEKGFKTMTPKALHGMYDVLKSELEKSMQIAEAVTTVDVKADLMTFEQFMDKLKA
jgi:cytidyltransferase-like protein